MSFCGIVGHHLGRTVQRLWHRLRLLWWFLLASAPRLVLIVLALAYVLAMFGMARADVTESRAGALLQLATTLVLSVSLAQFLASPEYQKLAAAEGDSRDAFDSFLIDVQTGAVVDEYASAGPADPNARPVG